MPYLFIVKACLDVKHGLVEYTSAHGQVAQCNAVNNFFQGGAFPFLDEEPIQKQVLQFPRRWEAKWFQCLFFMWSL